MKLELEGMAEAYYSNAVEPLLIFSLWDRENGKVFLVFRKGAIDEDLVKKIREKKKARLVIEIEEVV